MSAQRAWRKLMIRPLFGCGLPVRLNVHVPKAISPSKRGQVMPKPDLRGQGLQHVLGVPAANHDVVGEECTLEGRNRLEHPLSPPLLALFLQGGMAEVDAEGFAIPL